MDEGDEGAAALVFVHQVKLPQRPSRVQGRTGQIAHQVVELLLPGRLRQGGVLDVEAQVEVRVLLPVGRVSDQQGSLPEAPMPKKLRGDDLLEALRR